MYVNDQITQPGFNPFSITCRGSAYIPAKTNCLACIQMFLLQNIFTNNSVILPLGLSPLSSDLWQCIFKNNDLKILVCYCDVTKSIVTTILFEGHQNGTFMREISTPATVFLLIGAGMLLSNWNTSDSGECAGLNYSGYYKGQNY